MSITLLQGKEHWDAIKTGRQIDYQQIKTKCEKQDRFKTIENMMNIGLHEHLDADETLYHLKGLFTYYEGLALQQKYPALDYRKFTQVVRGGGELYDKSEWSLEDSFGSWIPSSPNNNTHPNVGTNLKWFEATRAWWVNGMQATDWDIRKARASGYDLIQRYVNTIFRTHEELCFKNFWLADGSATYQGTLGILYNSANNRFSLPNGTWANNTAAEIWEDVYAIINQPTDITYQTLTPCTDLIMSPSTYAYLETVFFADGKTTVIEKLRSSFPQIRIDNTYSMFDSMTTTPAGNSSKTIIVGLSKSPDNWDFEIPMPVTPWPLFQQGKVTSQGYETVVGSVRLYQPKSVVISEID